MTQLDDLKAEQAAQSAHLDQIDTKIVDVQAGVDGVQADLQKVIDRLAGGGVQDLTEVLAQAQSMSRRLGAVSTGLGAIHADLANSPKPPADEPPPSPVSRF